MEQLILRKVIEGDMSAFSTLVENNRHIAFSVAFRILNSREDAEEVVQDAFMKAFNALHSFRGESSFSTWLCRIVVRCALTRRKHETKGWGQNHSSDLPEIESATVEDGYNRLTHWEQKQHIDHVLNEMSVEERLLLTLYYLHERTLEEVSEIADISAPNVKMKLHRARKKMYLLMQKHLSHETHNLL